MFVKCNQSLFLLHGHRRTNNFTFLFIFGCFFVLFFAFSLLPLVVVRLFLDSYVVLFFLWSFLFAAFLKFGWCRDWFIFQWNNNNRSRFDPFAAVGTLKQKPFISVFLHICIHFNQPHNISFPPFFLVHLLAQMITGTSLSFLMGFAPSLPPSLLPLRFATGRIKCDPNSPRPSLWCTQSKISLTAVLLPLCCTTTAPACCL